MAKDQQIGTLRHWGVVEPRETLTSKGAKSGETSMGKEAKCSKTKEVRARAKDQERKSNL
jgi:hypothetical protein